MATERLFFGLWPDGALRKRLVAERERLVGKPGRLSHPLDLHLTLVFIGSVDDELLPCIESAAEDVVQAPFTLSLAHIRDWPRQRLWLAETDGVADALMSLVSQLQQNLLACGVPPENRRYRPHVTLARKAPPITALPLALDWPVSEFVLAGSAQGRTPSYRIHRAWPLIGTA